MRIFSARTATLSSTLALLSVAPPTTAQDETSAPANEVSTPAATEPAEEGGEEKIRVIRLTQYVADDLAAALREFLAADAAAQAANDEAALNLRVEPRRNVLIAAGDPARVQILHRLVKALDAHAPAPARRRTGMTTLRSRTSPDGAVTTVTGTGVQVGSATTQVTGSAPNVHVGSATTQVTGPDARVDVGPATTQVSGSGANIQSVDPRILSKLMETWVPTRIRAARAAAGTDEPLPDENFQVSVSGNGHIVSMQGEDGDWEEFAALLNAVPSVATIASSPATANEPAEARAARGDRITVGLIDLQHMPAEALGGVLRALHPAAGNRQDALRCTAAGKHRLVLRGRLSDLQQARELAKLLDVAQQRDR